MALSSRWLYALHATVIELWHTVIILSLAPLTSNESIRLPRDSVENQLRSVKRLFLLVLPLAYFDMVLFNNRTSSICIPRGM